MKLIDELILILLDEKVGYIDLIDSWDFSCVVAGSIIADLALIFKIDSDLEKLTVIDSEPPGDPILDRFLNEIVVDDTERTVQFWIEKFAVYSDEIVHEVMNNLVEKDILTYEAGGYWELSHSVAKTRQYRGADGSTVQEAKFRITNAILNDEIPSPRDVLLISILNSCFYFKLLLSEEDYAEQFERIQTLSNADLIGQSIVTSIQTTSLLPRAKLKGRLQPHTPLKLKHLLKSRKEFFAGNLPRGLLKLYRELGPVIDTPYKMGGQGVKLLMGPEVNQWFNRSGRLYLRTKDYIKGLEGAFGANRTLPGLDGAEHFRLRKTLRNVYSRGSLLARLPELLHLSRRGILGLKEGSEFSAPEKFKNTMGIQLGHLKVGVDCEQELDSLLQYKERAMRVYAANILPKCTLATPKMKRAKGKVADYIESIKAAHTPALRQGKPQDLADTIIELHRQDPQFFPETDITFQFAAALIAGVYLGSALGFVLYELIKHPEYYERVYEEAAKIFGGGNEPTAEDFSDENTKVTHSVFIESERLWPVIPIQVRSVMNHCYVQDYELKPDTRVIIGQTVPHFMEEFYSDPFEFNPDRFLSGRETTSGSNYAPYGLGTHHCLGHRYVEIQMIVNIMLLVYHFKLELAPSSYEMKLNPFPTAAPRRNMRIRVAEVRNPVIQSKMEI